LPDHARPEIAAGSLKTVENVVMEKQSSEEIDRDLPPPTGTLFVMFVYLGALCAMWGATYWLLVTR